MTVVEAEVDEFGEINLRRITSAVDTGIAVNPDTIVAQLEGGLIFGLTAALYGDITIDRGRVQQSNFNDYRMLRIDQTPKIDVHLIKSGEPPGGIGEPSHSRRTSSCSGKLLRLVTRIPWLLSNPWMRVVVLALSCFRVSKSRCRWR